jgi:hypothetical protein
VVKRPLAIVAMGVDRWSDQLSNDVKAWSDHVAGLAADALLEAGLINRDDFERSAAIISEEVFVRLCLCDFPPSSEAEPPPASA